MKHNKEILNELEAISSVVAALPIVNVYTVQNSYFAEMQKTILNAINENQEFAVPIGYFENLTTNILQKVKANDVAEELQNTSTTVASIGNKNVYVVPKNYFENIAYTAKEKEIVKLVPKNNGKLSVLRYAVAAVVTGLLGFGIFTFLQKNTTNNQTASIIKEADKIIATNSFENDFATLSDADLEKYLIQNGEDINAAMVATTAEEAELPEVMDYYLDENTLNNFLNENNLKN